MQNACLRRISPYQTWSSSLSSLYAMDSTQRLPQWTSGLISSLVPSYSSNMWHQMQNVSVKIFEHNKRAITCNSRVRPTWNFWRTPLVLQVENCTSALSMQRFHSECAIDRSLWLSTAIFFHVNLHQDQLKAVIWHLKSSSKWACSLIPQHRPSLCHGTSTLSLRYYLSHLAPQPLLKSWPRQGNRLVSKKTRPFGSLLLLMMSYAHIEWKSFLVTHGTLWKPRTGAET